MMTPKPEVSTTRLQKFLDFIFKVTFFTDSAIFYFFDDLVTFLVDLVTFLQISHFLADLATFSEFFALNNRVKSARNFTLYISTLK